jgi:hypothetical protein
MRTEVVVGVMMVQLHSFLTSKLNTGEWYPGCFTPGKELPVRTEEEAGWVPKPVCMLWRREKSLNPAGNPKILGCPARTKYVIPAH